ncbi:MAG: S8 family serine peptidase [Gammaproteobacteria bacterium]|nr:S8 family serine peptidase [Gammaproteobacteria bacterium]
MTKTLRAACAATVLSCALGMGAASADSFVVLAKKDLPADFASQVQAAGGTVTRTIPQIGVAIVEAPADFRSAAAGISGIQDIAADISVQMIQPNPGEKVAYSDYANPPASGEDDFYFNLQWGHQAIDAAGAWNAGFRGAGARVAVLDSGIDAEHPDLSPNLNMALSASFVPGEDWNIQPGFYFNHGTHVAGTIAAADNAYGAIGVAPEAELVAVKVLSEFTGSGPFSSIAAGMVYSGLIGADVANMSLGATIPHNCTFPDGNGGTVKYPSKDCSALLNMLKRAANFATQNGVLLVGSAGNEATDLDHNASNVKIPAELPGVLSISATAPTGWGLDPFNADFSTLSSFSNYGQSSIAFSAPGGDYDYPGNEVCFVGGIAQYCWVMDMVFSTISGGWSWSAGTSMASPHAAGVAALIVSKHGKMSPAQLVAKMKQSAIDLGKPGRDDVHGHGAVNAASAVSD